MSKNRCNCENLACVHKPAECPHEAGDARALYVGAICDGCAHQLPSAQLLAEPTHRKDSDCEPFLDDDHQCTVCGVSHTGGCGACDGRGFHEAGCPELTEGPQ